MRSLLTLFISTLLILNFSSLSPVQSQAQESPQQVGLSIVPALLDIPLQPGQEQTFSIATTNITDQPLPVVVGIQPLVPIDPQIDDELADRYDATSWVQAAVTDLILDPRETQNVDFTVTTPEDAGPGGHYLQIVFRVLTPAGSDQQSTTRINPELTASVLFTVPGDIQESIMVESSPLSLLSLQPERTMELIITNTGNSHVLLRPETIVRGSWRGGSAQIDLLPGQPKLLLPHTSTIVPITWRAVEPGYYYFDSSIRFGTPAQSIETLSSHFVVLPAWWVILSFITAATLLVVITINRLQSRRQRRSKLALSSKRHRKELKSSAPNFDELLDDPVTKDSSKRK